MLAEFEQHFLEWFNLPAHHATDWKDLRFTKNMWKVENYELFWRTVPRIFDPYGLDLKIAGYCTARACGHHTIYNWLLSNGFPSAPIFNVGYNGSKGKLLKNIGCDVFIDDAIHNFEDCWKHGVTCYLMTRPHNLEYDAKEYRVSNIYEFLNKIK